MTAVDKVNTDWQPSASLELIRLRAETVSKIRAYFDREGLLEVDTPVLSAATVPDPFIESFHTRYIPLTQTMQHDAYYLHTSPEFPMKRLLASGSGSIYQIAKVFRQGEAGRKHNPEFTLLEWYRVSWDHYQLMREVAALLNLLLSPFITLAETQYVTYEEAFQSALGINPHTVSHTELLTCTARAGLSGVLNDNDDRDRFLELLFSHIIEPQLGLHKQRSCICLLHHYPANQASLAKLAVHNGCQVAERFEIFVNGMELGNGFHELTDAVEQQARFTADNQHRKQMGIREIPMDDLFLQALTSLPDCAGVAIGIERLLMLMSGKQHINDVIAFPFERA